MTDWEDDSEQLRANLLRVLTVARDQARQRPAPSLAQARSWHSSMMRGLTTPGSQDSTGFRGEPGLVGCEVAIGNHLGVASKNVAGALEKFEEKLQRIVARLDQLIEPNQDLSVDDVAAVINLCAWVHSEWVRIHPFANGNGRTARLWANCIAMRYGLPPFVRLRPRPNRDYAEVSAKAMAGDWQPTVPLFRRMFRESLQR